MSKICATNLEIILGRKFRKIINWSLGGGGVNYFWKVFQYIIKIISLSDKLYRSGKYINNFHHM